MEEAFQRIHLGQSSRDANGNIKPHFFRIIIDPSLQLHCLRLPPAFSREHGRSMLAHAFLRAPEGEEHRVEVTTERDGNIWFSNGWNDFATSYSLEHGSFMVFRYEGNSRFHVFIFDTSCVEIDYENFGNESEDDEHAVNEEAHEEDVGSEDEDDDENHLDDNNNNQGTAKARARAFRSEDGHPFFVANMSSTYLSGDYRLWVSAKHAKECLLGEEGDLLLELAEPRGDDEEIWTVNFIREPEHGGRKTVVRITGTGWKGFAIDNGLRVQDACVFELVDQHSMTYRVHIFRN